MKYSYALGVLAMVFAAACSSASASSSPSATSTPASGATGVTVDLTDANQLQPTTITASAGTTVVSLLVAGAAIAMNVLWLIPIAAAAMLWGHYWDAENVMTIPSMVAAPRYRGVASGFSYIHTKLPQFLGIFLFPAFFRGHWRRQRDISYRRVPPGGTARGDLHPAGSLRLHRSTEVGARTSTGGGHAPRGLARIDLSTVAVLVTTTT